MIKFGARATWGSMVGPGIRPVRRSSNRSTAGLIVIGDEVLKAQIRDTNSVYALRLLHRHGVRSRKVSVVSDDQNEIANEIRAFSRDYDYVITSGGIGPTHDDVTYEALALAFDDSRHYHPTLVDIIRRVFGYEDPTSPSYKMAYVPTKAALRFGKNSVTGKRLLYPCVTIGNVYVFPGSPMFFEPSFASLCKELFSGNKGFATDEVYLNASEESFAKILTQVAEDYPNVSFGCYPENNRYYKSRVSIESDSEESTKEARMRFVERLPEQILVRFDREPHLNPIQKYRKFLQRTKRRHAHQNTFQRLVDLYQKPAEVSMLLDTGLRSILLLHLARTAIDRGQEPINAVYVDSGREDESTEEFLRDLVERYNVRLSRIVNGANFLNQLTDHLSRNRISQLLCGEKSIVGVLRNLGPGPNVQVHSPLNELSDQDALELANFLSLNYRD